MKILIIQSNGEHEANRSFRECFSVQRALASLGYSSDVWGKGHSSFKDEIDLDSYDLIINLENYDIDWIPDLSINKEPVKFLWSIDAHCRGMDPYIKEYERGNYDLILQSTEDYLNDNSIWMPNAYDDEMIYKIESVNKEYFIGFCGSILNRKHDLELLSKRFNLKNDYWVLGYDMVKAINSYKIHWNKNIANDINYRSFETIGCGTVICTNYNPMYEKLGFIDGKNCIIYEDTRDMMNKIRNIKNNNEKIIEMSNYSLELAKKHTYKKRAEFILELYEDKK